MIQSVLGAAYLDPPHMSGRLCKSENYVYTISIHEPPPFEASLTLTSLLTFSTGGAVIQKKSIYCMKQTWGIGALGLKISNIKQVKLRLNNDQPCIKQELVKVNASTRTILVTFYLGLF